MTSSLRQRYSLSEINALPLLTYARVMTAVFFKAAWVPVLASAQRPFSSTAAFLQAMMQVLRGSDEQSRQQVLREQPDLTDPPLHLELPPEFRLFTIDLHFSQTLAPAEKAMLSSRQQAFQENFALPYIYCPHQKSVQELCALADRRLTTTPVQEMETALHEVSLLAQARLQELLRPE
jgi:2-oxo-4-hydroxy-4-carboxy--5-ureidoimidazoline (OHCU) decarboxylase